MKNSHQMPEEAKKELATGRRMVLTGRRMGRKDKHNLYYLFPGMGRGARKRFLRNFLIAVIVGLIFSGGIAVVAYWMNH